MQGNKETWSKALTIGVLETAQIQKRDFACIIYASEAEEPIIIKKNEVNPDKILDCAEKFLGGGTNFTNPLEKAMKLIEESEFKNADIIFITDGDCRCSSAFITRFNKIKEEKEFRTIGVLVNVGSESVSDTELKRFCDTITKISNIADLTDGNSAANEAIFGAL